MLEFEGAERAHFLLDGLLGDLLPNVSPAAKQRPLMALGSCVVERRLGMTGARITGTLVNNLQTHDKSIGLETMCVSGGQGMAMLIERLA